MVSGPAFIALSRRGEALAARLAGKLGGEVHGLCGRVESADRHFEDIGAHLRALFAGGRAIVGISAAAILIRALAPLLADKRSEPPVVAVSEDGGFAVPLVGGHRGANALAQRIAALLGGKAAITTASDVAGGIALDEPPPGWRLLGAEEEIRAALVHLAAGAQIDVTIAADLTDIDSGWFTGSVPAAPSPGADRQGLILAEAEADIEAGRRREPGALLYVPQRHALGLGCVRGCDADELIDLARLTISQAGISPAAIAGVFSLDLKSDETAIHAVAARLGVEARFLTAAELEEQTPRLANGSEVVFREVGCHGVAEAAALAAVGPEGKLVVEKQRSAKGTAALAGAPQPLAMLPGRPRGRLSVVGIGPGAGDWRTPEASRLIAEADELIGYGLYLDLIGPLAVAKPCLKFPLGAEEERCRQALERAGKGRNVALISSGDAGIYAMGALVMELLDRPPEHGGVSDAARRVEVLMAPGITALQAASARTGALIGHDFCAISLSDLLTPRQDIVARIEAAARGDFVIAFYNPASRRRRTLLGEARDILLRHRSPETPVLVATNLGRAGERLRRCTLERLKVEDVDMLSVVLVGSSQSRAFVSGDGTTRFYTPRGYAAKSGERVSS